MTHGDAAERGGVPEAGAPEGLGRLAAQDYWVVDLTGLSQEARYAVLARFDELGVPAAKVTGRWAHALGRLAFRPSIESSGERAVATRNDLVEFLSRGQSDDASKKQAKQKATRIWNTLARAHNHVIRSAQEGKLGRSSSDYDRMKEDLLPRLFVDREMEVMDVEVLAGMVAPMGDDGYSLAMDVTNIHARSTEVLRDFVEDRLLSPDEGAL